MTHKMLIINGSPRANGNSSIIEAMIIDECKHFKFDIDIIDVKNQSKIYFNGDSLMFQKNNMQEPEIEQIAKQLLHADSIILIAPVYLHHIPAAFKNLLEHVSSMAHCFALHHKFFSTIVHSSTNGELQTSAYLEKIFAYMGATFIDRILYNDFKNHTWLNEQIQAILDKHNVAFNLGRYVVVPMQEKEFSQLKKVVEEEQKRGLTSAKQKGWKILENYETYQQFIDDPNNRYANTYN